jgi:protein TonB
MLHGGLLYLALFVLPKFLTGRNLPPPAYTVKIVDSIPAGDLGMHLPRLSAAKRAEKENAPESAKEQAPPAPSTKTEPMTEEPLTPENNKNAIALNSLSSASPTITPTPAPEPTAALTPEPTLAPTDKPTPATASTPKVGPRVKPAGAEPAGSVTKSQPKAHPQPSAAIQLAKALPTPSVQDQLAKIRKQLMAQHLANQKALADNDDSDEEGDPGATPADKSISGGGPVLGPMASTGAGFGIGEGTGSAGVLKNLDFLLYYRTVQERVKKAWNFSGGSPDLAATVTFSIGADGSLTDVKVTQSSKDSAYDDSVVRAIRKAAPFPPPPAQYRDQFGGGIEALFKQGEMNS